MVRSSHVTSDRSADGLPSEQAERGALRRLGLFLFGVMPSDTWRAPVGVWIALAISAALLLLSRAIQHWGFRPNGVDATALATAASLGSTVLLALVTVGSALVRARRLMSPPASATMRLEPKGIAWVGLYANDLAGLAGFYEHKLGLRLIEHDDGCYIFDAGAGALFEMWGKGHASTQRKTTHEQSMVIGFLVERLEPALASLAERGVAPDTEIGSHLGTRWIYFTDPEGNRFELKDNQGGE